MNHSCHLFLLLARSAKGLESLERVHNWPRLGYVPTLLASVIEGSIWDSLGMGERVVTKTNVHYTSLLAVQFPHIYYSFYT